MKGGNTKQGNKGAAAPRRLPSPFGPSSPAPLGISVVLREGG